MLQKVWKQTADARCGRPKAEGGDGAKEAKPQIWRLSSFIWKLKNVAEGAKDIGEIVLGRGSSRGCFLFLERGL